MHEDAAYVTLFMYKYIYDKLGRLIPSKYYT